LTLAKKFKCDWMGTAMLLSGKRALVTGAATGIGASIAIRLAERGADIAFTYYSHDPSDVVDAVRARGRNAIAFRVDARDSEAVSNIVEDAVVELGGLDILVNNSGGLVARRDLLNAADEYWRHVLDLNLSSVFYFARSCAAHLGSGGRIVSVSSLAAHNGGGPGAFAYSAAKAGLHGLTRALAKDLAPRGITVNAVAPGFILDTPFHTKFTQPDAQAAAIRAIPVGRAGNPDDIASAVDYLVSAEASFCTGVVLDLNGGSYFV
jgi:3-oxoacyl-[acyl-carrier protein] reductase